MKSLRIIIFFLLIFSERAFAQREIGRDAPSSIILDANPRIMSDSFYTWQISGICKPLRRILITDTAPVPGISQIPARISTIKITGNIQYDYLFRSFADTPYFQKDFRQHTIQTSLTLTIKDKYPFRLNLIVRKSNSPYFKNFLDGGMVFDRHSYLKNAKQLLLTKLTEQLPELPYLDAAKKLLQMEVEKFNLLKGKLGSNDLVQQLIAEKEKKYLESLKQPQVPVPQIKTAVLDSIQENLSGLVDSKKKELDSLQNNIRKLQHRVDSIQGRLTKYLADARQMIHKAKSPQDLLKVSAQYGMNEKKEKWEKIINGLKTVGIGRSMLNYSELTARNISLTGVNLEYNDGIYLALTAGKIDYGFRDFFGRSDRSRGQYLVMGRFGIGDIEKTALIFSLFTGRKAAYGTMISDTVSGYTGITGYSLETIIRKNDHTFLSAEIAKSTNPFSGSYSSNKQMGSLFRFSDRSNLGISIKAQTHLAGIKTRLSTLFRKTGENYQSFSLFSYNTDQTAWMIKGEQPILSEKILVTGIIRKNDFVNPLTEKTFRTSTVFGSLQVSVRIPKWPSVSLGYYPGSQLYIIDRNRVRENVYYIMNGTMVHSYSLSGIRMASSAVYNNYTNRGTDSGFVNYSGKTWLFSQSVYFRILRLDGVFSVTDQPELKFFTTEGQFDLSITKSFRFAAGAKYNKIYHGKTHWGGTGQLIFDMKDLGSLQLHYEKSFLPTIQQELFPVEIGRLTWIKIF